MNGNSSLFPRFILHDKCRLNQAINQFEKMSVCGNGFKKVAYFSSVKEIRIKKNRPVFFYGSLSNASLYTQNYYHKLNILIK